MSRTFGRARGGSASAVNVETGGGTKLLFNPKVNYLSLSTKNPIRGRILPCRDYSLSTSDPAYKSSWIPYRDSASGEMDETTHSPEFTGWFLIMQGYRFFGAGQMDFWSPRSLKAFDPSLTPSELADPLNDCRNLAWNSGNPAWKTLAEKPALKPGQKIPDRPILPKPSNLVLMNMWAEELQGKEPGFKNIIAIKTLTALECLKLMLAHPPLPGIAPHHPEWPYVYGDITHPQNGLVVQSRQVKSGELTVTGWSISNKDYTLQGAQSMAVPPEAMNDRYDFDGETIKIMSYQEIVDLIVDEPSIPHELIEQACGEKSNVPTKAPGKNKTISTPASHEAGSGAANTDVVSAPNLDEKYWVTVNNQTIEMTVDEIRALLHTDPTIQVMKLDQSGGWKTAAEQGIQ